MIRRLNVSLFKAEEIGKYLKDKVGYVILYILFLSLIVTIPKIIQLSVNNSLDSTTINRAVGAIQSSDIDGKIVDYKYVGKSFSPISLGGQYYFGVKSKDTNKAGFVFMLEEEQIDIYAAGQKTDSLSLKHLELENLDFKLSQKVDRDNLGNTFNSIYLEYKTINVVMNSITEFFAQFILAIFLIFLVVAINSFMQPKMIFKYRFILTSYASTVYFLTVLLDQLFGVTFISFIGIIMMSINLRKAYTRLLKITLIEKRKETDENE